MTQEITLRDIQSAKPISFKREPTSLKVKLAETKHAIEIPYRQVIAASFNPDNSTLDVAYLYRKKKADNLTLVKLRGKPQGLGPNLVTEWAETLMKDVYEDSGVTRSRRLKVLVNPHGGVRKGAAVFVKTVEPIFRAAQCSLDVIYTTHNGHAFNIAKDLPLVYDAVVTVSGDGLIHEVMNGFAHHINPRKAFKIPIAPIPTGSGNGLALNLLGIEVSD
ncbi:hypothetical protein H0H81_011109 [Sphagnurus paluster]|uniref:DAGKc domain-containing protein n=1 Tax=Sphagnurus paluster TaxID=117069 RepID=A0A9P7GNY4_9AGAR|nr:hypothetical protein H0H81_011109 [Sphagnurus paluster]